jgi:hypothetical protein
MKVEFKEIESWVHHTSGMCDVREKSVYRYYTSERDCPCGLIGKLHRMGLHSAADRRDYNPLPREDCFEVESEEDMGNLDALIGLDGLSRRARRVLVGLMAVTDASNTITRPIDEICRALAIGKTSWFDGAKELEERGLLTRKKQGYAGLVRCTVTLG